MPTPNLGYGTRGEAPINSVNQWMRSQPWYQQLITSFGQNPNSVHLNDDQKQQVIRAAQANGVVVDEGHDGQQIDDSGNFEAKGHGLRNTLIVAGIAGAALLTAGAAGMFGGAALGAGEGAAGAGAGAGVAADAGMFGPLAAGYGAATTTAAAPAGIAAIGGAGAAAGGAAAAGGGKVAATLFGVPADDIFKTGASLFGNLFGANMQISAADRSAAATAAAAKYAADLLAKANADALAFQYGSAENSFLNNEAARRGNYNQDAAHQRRLGTIGEEVGLGPREIPDYVPGVDPHFGGGGGTASGGGAPSSALMPADGEVNWTAPADQLGSQLTAYFKKRGVAASEVPYWVQQASSLVQRGQQLNDPLYASKRLAAAEVFGGGGAQPAAAAPVARPYAPTTAATPFMNAVPQSIGYYA